MDDKQKFRSRDGCFYFFFYKGLIKVYFVTRFLFM